MFSLWSLSTVNNTLTEAEKSKDKAKDTEKGKEIHSDKEIIKTKGEGQQNITDVKESVGGKDVNTAHENTTTVGREDKYISTIPKKTVPEDRNEEELEARNAGSEKPTGGSKVDSKDPDNILNTVENKEPEVVKPPERKGSPDTNLDIGKTDIMEIVPKKDKGQEEKERKEEQVNGKRDSNKVGPNDTKLRTIISESENTVEISEWEVAKNNTLTHDAHDRRRENNTKGSLDPGKKTVPTILNITQYRAGGEESVKPKELEDKTEDSTRETERQKKENEQEKEVNQSFTGKKLSKKMTQKCTVSHLLLGLSVYSPFICREKLPASASPLPWLPPGGARITT